MDTDDMNTKRLITELEMIAEQLEINQLLLQGVIHRWRAERNKSAEDLQLTFSYML